jgi:hypothetical protein
MKSADHFLWDEYLEMAGPWYTQAPFPFGYKWGNRSISRTLSPWLITYFNVVKEDWIVPAGSRCDRWSSLRTSEAKSNGFKMRSGRRAGTEGSWSGRVNWAKGRPLNATSSESGCSESSREGRIDNCGQSHRIKGLFVFSQLEAMEIFSQEWSARSKGLASGERRYVPIVPPYTCRAWMFGVRYIFPKDVKIRVTRKVFC